MMNDKISPPAGCFLCAMKFHFVDVKRINKFATNIIYDFSNRKIYSHFVWTKTQCLLCLIWKINMGGPYPASVALTNFCSKIAGDSERITRLINLLRQGFVILGKASDTSVCN